MDILIMAMFGSDWSIDEGWDQKIGPMSSWLEGGDEEIGLPDEEEFNNYIEDE